MRRPCLGILRERGNTAEGVAWAAFNAEMPMATRPPFEPETSMTDPLPIVIVSPSTFDRATDLTRFFGRSVNRAFVDRGTAGSPSRVTSPPL